jgi:hypothetical protein
VRAFACVSGGGGGWLWTLRAGSRSVLLSARNGQSFNEKDGARETVGSIRKDKVLCIDSI